MPAPLSRPPGCRDGHRVDALEALPDPPALRLGNAWPFVAHAHVDPAATPLHPHLDWPVLWCIVEGVRQIVGRHLTDAIGIGQHRGEGECRPAQPDRARGSELPLLLDDVVHQGSQVTGLQMEGHVAITTARHLHQVVYQAGEPGDTAARLNQQALYRGELTGQPRRPVRRPARGARRRTGPPVAG
jgi:hypothetical protein